MKDYYQALGITKETDIENIKKAYRQLAKQHHPDRNPGDPDAENKFKEVQEAYDVLSDERKRANYDFQMFAPPVDSFQDLFNFVTQRPRQSNWGQHIELVINMDFFESIRGCKKTVNIEKRDICKSCKGTTAKDGKEFKACVLCDGKGKVAYNHGVTGSFMRFESSCQSCKGTGKIIEVYCTDCVAKGFVLKACALEVKLPAGIHDGMKVCVRGEGDIGLNGPGNLYCIIRVKSHPVFQREGINLLLKMPITYSQSVLGAEITVPSLEGEVKLKLPPGTKSGATFRLPGLGCVIFSDEDESNKGDLLVKIVIDVPDITTISGEYKELLAKLGEYEKEFPGESYKNFQKNLKEGNE